MRRFLERFAEEGKRIYGETIANIDATKRHLVLKQAVGGCASDTVHHLSFTG